MPPVTCEATAACDDTLLADRLPTPPASPQSCLSIRELTAPTSSTTSSTLSAPTPATSPSCRPHCPPSRPTLGCATSSSPTIYPTPVSCSTECPTATRSPTSASSPATPIRRFGSGYAVVGWPPIRAFRVNSLVNQLKDNADASAKKKAANLSSSCSKTEEGNGSGKGREKGKGVLFMKVNMDGDPIGRKVDLNAHLSYESLAAALKKAICDVLEHCQET